MNEILFGDARGSLRKMAADGVKAQMCVTSPPYFGLRDYGVDGQIGLEETPEQFIAELVDVFRCVRDVLADDGVLFVNIGDSYAGSWGARGRGAETNAPRADLEQKHGTTAPGRNGFADMGIKGKDLIGIPWMLAFALRADGWYLRQDIIWQKPNPMPESVTDRCTKAHEYIFLLSKSPRYFYDAEAVKEQAVCGDNPPGNTSHRGATAYAAGDEKHRTKTGLASYAARVRESRARGSFNGKTESLEGRNAFRAVVNMRNRRSVWTVATKPYKGAHFATFPEALITPCVLAGSRPAGKRCDCAEIIGTPTGTGAINDPSMEVGRAGMSRPRRTGEGTRPITRLEQRHHAQEMKQSPHRAEMEQLCGPGFAHYIRTDASGARPLPEALRRQFLSNGWITAAPECTCPVEPGDIVLDPFMGSGTTAAVAITHGRQYAGCELNADYKALQDERIAAARSALNAPAKVRRLAAKVVNYRQLDIFGCAA